MLAAGTKALTTVHVLLVTIGSRKVEGAKNFLKIFIKVTVKGCVK